MSWSRARTLHPELLAKSSTVRLGLDVERFRWQKFHLWMVLLRFLGFAAKCKTQTELGAVSVGTAWPSTGEWGNGLPAPTFGSAGTLGTEESLQANPDF